MNTKHTLAIDCAVHSAAVAWRSGRPVLWPDPDDYRNLEDVLKRQPSEIERGKFAAAWHGYMACSWFPPDKPELEPETEAEATVINLPVRKEKADD